MDDKAFWHSWQKMYPVYKKIYPSMNPELYWDKVIEKLLVLATRELKAVRVLGVSV